jgi:hypothetical protein
MLRSHKLDEGFVYWDDLVPKDQTVFAAELFGDRRTFAVN